jgi:hypothetical protein
LAVALAAALYRASGLVLWPDSDLPGCPLFRRCWENSGRPANIAKATFMTDAVKKRFEVFNEQ